MKMRSMADAVMCVPQLPGEKGKLPEDVSDRMNRGLRGRKNNNGIACKERKR